MRRVRVSTKCHEHFAAGFMRMCVLSRSGQFLEEPVFTVGSVFCVAYLEHLVKLVGSSSRVYTPRLGFTFRGLSKLHVSAVASGNFGKSKLKRSTTSSLERAKARGSFCVNLLLNFK